MNSMKLENLIVVRNGHTFKPTGDEYVVYVGRSTSYKGIGLNAELGNPHKDYGKELNIKLYKVHLEHIGSELHNNVMELFHKIKPYITQNKPVVLLCWCYPKACHADVIREYLIQMLKDEQSTPNEDLPPWEIDNKPVVNKTTTITLHSGGAYGADTLFAEQAEKYGIQINHYFMGVKSEYNAPNGNKPITGEDISEGKLKVAVAANLLWGYQYSTMSDQRLVRNWAQVKYTDAIYAVANVVLAGEPVGKSINDKRQYKLDFVSGGTAYAVMMGIIENKPIYFYAQDLDSWFTWNYQTEDFEEIPPPTITETNFTGIGSRVLNDKGKQAIIDLMRRSFNERG